MKQTKRKVGRPRIEIDLKRVEELAALGLTQARIAEGLGVSEQTISDRVNGDNPGFSDAIKRGHFQWSETLAEKVAVRLKTGGRDADNLLMFSTKQYHGLGWMDERSVRHSGRIEHTIRAVDQAWETRKKALESTVIDTKTDTQEVTEAEYADITNE